MSVSRPYSLYATTPGGANGSATTETMSTAMRRSIREPATPLNVSFFGPGNLDALQRDPDGTPCAPCAT
jgi:hypothetical protein